MYDLADSLISTINHAATLNFIWHLGVELTGA